MERYYIVKNGRIEGSTATRENAIDFIRVHQEEEKRRHQWLRAEFSIIKGTEEFINYEK